MESSFDFQKEKITLTKLSNSPLKRSILGIFLRIHKEFVTNVSWNANFYDRISFTAGKKEKLKKAQIDKIIHEPKAKESLQFLIDFKLLLPLPVPEDLSEPLPNIDELLNDHQEYKIITGIEFDEDVFATSTGGLKITVGAIHHLLYTMLNFKATQAKVQLAMDELLSFPSRSQQGRMLILFDKFDKVSKSTSKKNIFYKIADETFEMLNLYHPLKNHVNTDKNGSTYLHLLTKSLSINQIVAKSVLIGINTKKNLKLLDSQFVLKNTISLVEKILIRELFILDFDSYFDDLSRIDTFRNILDRLSNESELGIQFLKEANLTNNPLPSVFEYIDPFEKPFGVVDEFLTAFSRLYIAQVIGQIVSNLVNKNPIFKPKAGDEIFPMLFSWLETPINEQLLEAVEELVTEASFLVEYYTKEDLETISKSFKEQ